MRILFVSFFFPPYNEIGAVRTGKTAKYLLAFGHDVRVISALDQSIRSATLPVEIPRERITYTHWLSPRWPVEQVYGRKRRPPWRDQGVASHPQSVRRRAFAGLQRLVRTLYFPDPQLGWFPFAYFAAAKCLATWRPDLILASSSPQTSLLVAHSLANRFALRWIGDLRDLWTDYQYYQFGACRRRIEEKLERHVLSSAAGLVTVSQPLANTLIRKFSRPTTVILNGYDVADYPQCSEATFQSDLLRIVYTGMIYANRQSPAPLFEALHLLGSAAEKVRVIFYGVEERLVYGLASQYGITTSVQVMDAVPHLQALRAQSEADILLHLLWNDSGQPGVYNAKLFEYIGAHRPVLAVGQTNNVAADLIRERGAGVALNDPEQIARQLEQWIQLKEQIGKIPALDSSVAVGLSREEQSRKLEAFLYETLGRSP